MIVKEYCINVPPKLLNLHLVCGVYFSAHDSQPLCLNSPNYKMGPLRNDVHVEGVMEIQGGIRPLFFIIFLSYG